MTNFVLFLAILAATFMVWQARWSQAPFDWLGLLATGYFLWSVTPLDRYDLMGIAIFLCACIARAELHRNGVVMPCMWWRD